MTNPYLDVDKKVMAEIYTSSEPMDNLEILCDVHDSRWPGSGKDLESCEYMAERLTKYGL